MGNKKGTDTEKASEVFWPADVIDPTFFWIYFSFHTVFITVVLTISVARLLTNAFPVGLDGWIFSIGLLLIALLLSIQLSSVYFRKRNRLLFKEEHVEFYPCHPDYSVYARPTEENKARKPGHSWRSSYLPYGYFKIPKEKICIKSIDSKNRMVVLKVDHKTFDDETIEIKGNQSESEFKKTLAVIESNIQNEYE